jgi:hypothetical protein
LIEQEPGPRGSPQDPQGPTLAARCGGLAALTANTDNCFSMSALAQAGQAGVWPARVKNSNWRPHAWHRYSKSGMPHCDKFLNPVSKHIR